MAGQKIGIMGGTFNPIHNGHLMLAEQAYEQFELDQVLIMPNKKPYYKEIEGGVSEEDREAMVRLAVDENDHFCFSDIELTRNQVTYTVDTLEELHKNNPDNEYYFIMGQDSLDYLESWKNAERIMELAVIVAACRNDRGDVVDTKIQELKERFCAKIVRLNSPNLEISSSYLREALHHGRSCRYLIPDAVLRYIKEKKLYE